MLFLLILYAISVWDMYGVVLLAVLTQSLSTVIQSVTDVVIVCLTQHPILYAISFAHESHYTQIQSQ